MLPLPHPWRRLRSLGDDVKLKWHDGGTMGKCKHSTQEVSLRRDLSQAERRSALLHELEHLAKGPAVVGYKDEDERVVRERAARWLIPLPNLIDGLVWCVDDVELADHLWVDLGTVRTRLSTLSDGESAAINAHLDAAEQSFPSA